MKHGEPSSSSRFTPLLSHYHILYPIPKSLARMMLVLRICQVFTHDRSYIFCDRHFAIFMVDTYTFCKRFALVFVFIIFSQKFCFFNNLKKKKRMN